MTATTAGTRSTSTSTSTSTARRADRHLGAGRAQRSTRPVCAAPARRRVVPPVAAAVPTSRVQRTRLTRRGRLTILLVLAALLFAAFSFGRAASQAASEPAATAQLEQTTVQPGDTLWAIARRIAPEHDPREVIDQLRKVNDLGNAGLQAGQQLLVPTAR